MYVLLCIIQKTIVISLAGHIISDRQPLRHFCLVQLRQIWLFLRCNLSLSDEERSFLIMQVMYRLFEVCKYLSNCMLCK